MQNLITNMKWNLSFCLILVMTVFSGLEVSAKNGNAIDRNGNPIEGSLMDNGQSVEPQDSLALVAFYDAMNGHNWYDNSGWLSEMVEFWHGIRVEEVEVETDVFEWRVTRVDLESNFLQGEIPVEIGNLEWLQYFNVQSNHVFGNIPKEIGNLHDLRRIFVTGNPMMTGELPWDELISLQNLIQFHANGVNFHGEIPESVSDFQRLERIHLQGSRFTGNMPAGFGDVETLVRIQFANAFFTGGFPEEWKNIPELDHIQIRNMPFFDPAPIPEWFQEVETFQEIRIEGTNRTGEIPGWFATMPNIRDIGVGGYDQLEGPIPDLTFASNLRRLFILDSEVSGPIPGWLGVMPNLWLIDFQGNNISGPIPQTLANSPTLHRITLRRLPNLEGPLPDFRNLDLLDFRLDSLNFDIGPFPDWLESQQSLSNFQLSYVGAEGPIPDSWSQLINIRRLRLDGNTGITGALPDWLTTGNDRLQMIHLGYTNVDIGEEFPAWVRSKSQLESLDLQGLGISGPIPGWLNELILLDELLLADNELSGSIPGTLGDLEFMQNMNLANNQLSGELPPELFNMGLVEGISLLTEFDVSGNTGLTGPIPVNITEYNPDIFTIFHYDGTDLCEPTDAGFQDWLQAMHDTPAFPTDARPSSIRGTGVTCGTETTAENYDGKPYRFALSQNYPNPFNPSTHISYEIPEQSSVRLSVYNVIGQQVVTLVNETMSPGRHEVTFDASGFSSGTYIYRLEAGGRIQTQSMILIK